MQITNSTLSKFSLSRLSVMFFSCSLLTSDKWFLLQCGVISTCKYFKDFKLHLYYLSFKNLPVHINTKLHLKLCCYLYYHQCDYFQIIYKTQKKALRLSERLTNARNVSFETLCGGQFTSWTLLIIPNYLVFQP